MSDLDCAVCGTSTRALFSGRVLGRHNAHYRQCQACQFVFIEEPSWLPEAYSRAIATMDTGLVQRNLLVSRWLAAVYGWFFPTGPYVDWAGGYGLLVRLLRDAGFDARWQDAYASNLHAEGFEWSGGQAQVVSAIEALEHVTSPVQFLSECLNGSGASSVIFTQRLHTGVVSPTWDYLVPETGQHIGFFSPLTLRALADRLSLNVLSSGVLHLLTDRDIPLSRFDWVVRHAGLAGRIANRHRGSLTEQDSRLRSARLGGSG